MEEKEERLRDRAEWIRSGQLWIDAFTTPAKQRVQRYLHENKRGTTILNTGVMDPTNRFGKVADLYLEESDYRPGARRAIWSWASGRCVEVLPRVVATEAKYNIDSINEVAKTIDFKDIEALKWLTKWRSDHKPTTFLCALTRHGTTKAWYCN